jgi:hypothetical protein
MADVDPPLVVYSVESAGRPPPIPTSQTVVILLTFYAIPRQFGVPPSYGYDEIVLVDPITRQVVDVVD